MNLNNKLQFIKMLKVFDKLPKIFGRYVNCVYSIIVCERS